jgi:uncharacterized protein
VKNLSLITGASKGIGKAIAFELAKTGSDLILVARSKDLIENLAKELKSKFEIKVYSIEIDLTKETAMNDVVEFCKTNNLNPNILINNAGFGLKGSFESLSYEKQIGMINLNISSLVSLTYKTIPTLKLHPKSYILNVGSVASFYPIPYFSIYAATKAFVLSFSNALNIELKSSNIYVSTLCPGPTQSSFWEASGVKIKSFAPKIFQMTSERVAKVAIKGMFKGKRMIVPGIFNKIQVFVRSLVPTNLILFIFGKIWKKSDVG